MLSDRMLTTEEGEILHEHWKVIEALYRRIGVQADIIITRTLTTAEREREPGYKSVESSSRTAK